MPHVAVKLAAVPPLVEFVKATEICSAPAVATTPVGAPGAVTAVPELAVMLYFCSRVTTVVDVAVTQAPDVAAKRWIKPA